MRNTRGSCMTSDDRRRPRLPTFPSTPCWPPRSPVVADPFPRELEQILSTHPIDDPLARLDPTSWETPRADPGVDRLPTYADRGRDLGRGEERMIGHPADSASPPARQAGRSAARARQRSRAAAAPPGEARADRPAMPLDGNVAATTLPHGLDDALPRAREPGARAPRLGRARGARPGPRGAHRVPSRGARADAGGQQGPRELLGRQGRGAARGLPGRRPNHPSMVGGGACRGPRAGAGAGCRANPVARTRDGAAPSCLRPLAVARRAAEAPRGPLPRTIWQRRAQVVREEEDRHPGRVVGSADSRAVGHPHVQT